VPYELRAENVANVFVATRPLTDARVLLIDDVVTSTQTARQASIALKRVGAKEIRVLAIARAPQGAGQAL